MTALPGVSPQNGSADTGAPRAGKVRGEMYGKGIKITDLVAKFGLEVINQGSDYDTARITVTNLNRPGLQFHDFYDYFDPRRLQVIGKAEVTYLKSLTEERRRKCFDDLFLYDIPALVISRGLDCFPECLDHRVRLPSRCHGRNPRHPARQGQAPAGFRPPASAGLF